jgi:hypothetical protein
MGLVATGFSLRQADFKDSGGLELSAAGGATVLAAP